METLEFKEVDNKIYPAKQLVRTFFISSWAVHYHGFEVKPLTLHDFLIAILRNNLIICKWFIARRLYLMGFLDVPDGATYSREYFRWDFWNVLKNRRIPSR